MSSSRGFVEQDEEKEEQSWPVKGEEIFLMLFLLFLVALDSGSLAKARLTHPLAISTKTRKKKNSNTPQLVGSGQ